MIALWLACAEPAAPPAAEPPVEVHDWIAGKPTGSNGTLVVVTEADAELTVTLPEPAAPGLTFRPDGEPRVERVGDRVVTTQRWVFSGGVGHYEIPPLVVAGRDADGATHESQSTSVFVDLGVPPPSQGEIADIAEPPEVLTVPWRPVVVFAGLGALVAAGAYFAFRRPKAGVMAAVPPEPPDVVAIRAWEAVRRDPTLSDYDKALALSRIFREYAEAVLRFPATAWTTTETLQHLASLAHLPEGNVPRAKRLLRATDRVKYAEAAAGEDLFVDLDADLRAFVGSTRPRGWEAAP